MIFLSENQIVYKKELVFGDEVNHSFVNIFFENFANCWQQTCWSIVFGGIHVPFFMKCQQFCNFKVLRKSMTLYAIVENVN